MPQTNAQRENRYATRSNMNQLRRAAGIPVNTRTESRFAFARRAPLNPNAAPFVPTGAAPSMLNPHAAPFVPSGAAASARRSRRHRKTRRATRRANRR